MYCEFFGLRCRPFEDKADARFYHATAECDEALASMEYESRYGKGATLILGDAGTGKTLLVRTLLQRLHATDHAVVVAWPASGEMSLIREVCKRFGVTLPASYNEDRSLARLRRHLLRTHRAKHRSILIIDQAEHLSADNIAELTTLTGVQDDGTRLLSMILVGQLRFREVLDQPSHAGIRQHLYGERTIPAMSITDSEAYVAHRLRVAGAGDTDIFAPGAVELIHTAARGIARLINHMCDAALLAAYGAGDDHVTRAMAAEVIGKRGPSERTVDAQSVGLGSATAVADGLTVSSAYESIRDGADDAVATANRWTPGDDSIDRGAYDALSRSSAPWDAAPLGAMPGASATSILVDGEALLNRLERASARAERVATTTDASLTKYAAMEKHLASLTREAERLVGTLAGAVTRSSESIDGVQHRVSAILDRSDARVRELDAHTARTANAGEQAEDRIERLLRVCEQADRAETQLTACAEQFADKADDVQERVGLLMTGLDSGAETRAQLDALIKQAAAVIVDADARIKVLGDTLEETSSSAQRIEAGAAGKVDSLRRTFETVKRDAETFEQQFTESALATCRAKLTEQVDAQIKVLGNTLEETSNSAQRIQAAAAGNVESLRRSFETVKRDAEVFEQQFTESMLATCRVKLTEQVDAQMRAHKQAIEAEITKYRGDVRAMIENLTARVQDLGELIAGRKQEAEAAASAATEAFAKTQTAVQAGAEVLDRRLEDMVRRQASIQSRMDLFPAEIDAVAERVDVIHDRMEQVESDVTGLAMRGETVAARLAESVPQGEKLFAGLQGMYGQAEAMHRSASTTLVELGGAHERVVALREELRDASETIDRLSAGRTKADATVERLEACVGTAKAKLVAIQDEVAHVSGCMEQRREASQQATQAAMDKMEARTSAVAEQIKALEQQSNASVQNVSEQMRSLEERSQGSIRDMSRQCEFSTTLLAELTDATATGEVLTREVNETIDGTKALLAELADRTRSWTDLRDANLPTIRQIEDLVGTATQLNEALQGAVAHADSKVGQLDSHNAAAGSVLRRLTEATVASHELVERIAAASDKVQGTIKSGEQIVQDVWETTSRTETNTRNLVTANKKAVELIKTLGSVAEPAREIVKRIDERTVEAKQCLDGLASRFEAADEIVERLDSVQYFCDTIKGTEGAIHETTEQATEICQKLADATQSAITYGQSLSEINAEAHGLIETSGQMKKEADASIDRLTTQVSTTRRVIEKSSPMLREFIAHSRQLNEQVDGLQRRADEIEETVKGATSRPAEIIAGAQEQAAQLENVVAAVRKVFGMLSKASLDAQNKVNDFQRASDDAKRKLAQLTDDTTRAAGTLQVWVEEAVRVQSRMERTIQQAPSIAETHSGDHLRRMSRSLDPVGRIANASATGELTMLNEPRTSTGGDAPVAPPSRADEVTKIIENARQAAAGAAK